MTPRRKAARDTLGQKMSRERPWRRRGLSVFLLGITVVACGKSIWNASDLIEWVREQAVARGCQRESIALEEWYRSEDGKNVWHGTCLRSNGGAPMTFAIDVDSVWTPSSPT